jgi:hypothetical protein
VSLIIDGTSGVTFNDASLQGAAASPYVLKNRIINGDMVIDQRNAGASITLTNGYSLDRWQTQSSPASKATIQQNAGAVTPPVGFVNYAGITSTSAYSVAAGDYFNISQPIEGYNVSDLAWGTANAKTVTLSFWVRSSLTGTFGGSLRNSAADRSYPFTYSISAANTWEYKTVTIAGDTTGTWLKTNGNGLSVFFSVGAGSTYSGTAGAWAAANYVSATGATSVVGTNGATFYITGVQLEQNTSATPFERRLYNQELANCQRYYTQSWGSGAFSAVGNAANGTASNGSNAVVAATFQVSMRAAPTVTLYDNTGASGKATQPFIANGLAATAGGIGINGFKDVSGSGYTSNSAFFANYIASIEL